MYELKRQLGWMIITLIFLLTGCSNSGDLEGKQTEGEVKGLLKGYWEGTINVPNQPLEISVQFQKEEEWEGTISIPLQNVEAYPLADIEIDGNRISFQMPVSGQALRFDGTVNEKKLSGTFTQAGQSYSFALMKGKQKQESESGTFLSIETPTGKLYGELLMPDGVEEAPVALIIPGSGPTDRNGNTQGSRGNNSLKLLAEGLAEEGIASLRYDKRGAGRNAQAVVEEDKMRFEVFVNDAEQWLERLKQEERFTNIAVIGHSQGSLVGMMAAEPETTDAFVSLAGAGRPIDRVLEDQLKESLPEDLYEESETILEQLRKGEEVTKVRSSLQQLFSPDVQPFLRSWMAYDPSEQLSRLEVPILIINGEHDLQVSVEEARRLKAAKPEAELVLLEGMNHVLKDAPVKREENLATYTNPDLPLKEGLVEEVVKFLRNHNFYHSE
ncbi:alpha/beta hydrolase [Halobacillus litoralis]|uniref:alpha/beta hydrolase n=1 Tax=Halobacillus litoralis TaxID=45668 RepID=UPI001CFF3BCA|nr:alpha/beta fold hydrolase [Halobacillus litoralis]